MKVILASASPRRKELLEQIGMEFEVIPATGEEMINHTKPYEVVMDLSRQKAEEVAKRQKREDCLIIGADTVVAFEDEILGKPKDREDAYRMLSMLEGKTHKVYTGVTLLLQNEKESKTYSFYEETEVVMHSMTQKEKNWYVDTNEPYDKAGGYAIQGRCAVFIEKINGDYNNVVGLPIARIYQELLQLGIDIYE